MFRLLRMDDNGNQAVVGEYPERRHCLNPAVTARSIGWKQKKRAPGATRRLFERL